MRFQLCFVPDAVQEEAAAWLQAVQHIVFVDIRLIVASDKVSFVDEIRRFNGRFAKTQMAHGYAAGLLGVIGKVALRIHVCMVADNFNGALIGADGAVGTQAPELTGFRTGRSGIEILCWQRQAQIGHVVDNTDSEAVFGLRSFEVIEYRNHMSRREFFGTQAITAANDNRLPVFNIVERRFNVLE